MVTMKLGCMSESCFHFLHLTHTGTCTVDGNNSFLKMSVRPQDADEERIRFILPLEHTEMFFNVLLKLRMARSRTQYTGQ
jgi:hypothetical protein